MNAMTVEELMGHLKTMQPTQLVVMQVVPDLHDEANPRQLGGVLVVRRGTMEGGRVVCFLEGHTC